MSQSDMRPIVRIVWVLLAILLSSCSGDWQRSGAPAIETEATWEHTTIAARYWSRLGHPVTVASSDGVVTAFGHEWTTEVRIVAGPIPCGEVPIAIGCSGGGLIEVAASELSGISSEQLPFATQWTIAHELGHAMGQQHSTDGGVMDVANGSRLSSVPSLDSLQHVD